MCQAGTYTEWDHLPLYRMAHIYHIQHFTIKIIIRMTLMTVLLKLLG